MGIFPAESRGVASAAIALLLPVQLHAQSLTVSPVNIELPAGQSTVVMTVTNDGRDPTTYQIRPFVWTQGADGNEVLTATKEVLVSPPLGTIAPAATQTVRLMLRKRPGTSESSYRIIIDQLPGPATGAGTRMVLRFSIPMFALPVTTVASRVSWNVETRGSARYLVGINHGARHAKFWDMAVAAAPGGPVALEPGGPNYILAGATHSWQLATTKGSGLSAKSYTLSARDDQGAISQVIANADEE